MNIVVGRPPNFDKIAAAIPAAKGKNVYFTYGDTIYNPGGGELSAALRTHERVHSRQQLQYGLNVGVAVQMGPDLWWERYLRDKTFRFQEELEAHAFEFLAATRGQGRNERRRYLSAVAERLSSPLYGRLMTKAKAADHIAAMASYLNEPMEKPNAAE